MGQGAAEAGQPKHHHCACGKQGGFSIRCTNRSADVQLDLVSDSSATPAAPAEAPSAEETEDERELDESDEDSPAKPDAEEESSEDNVRQVSTAEAEAYAKECGLLFFEASAKVGTNVNEVFTEIGASSESVRWKEQADRSSQDHSARHDCP